MVNFLDLFIIWLSWLVQRIKKLTQVFSCYLNISELPSLARCLSYSTRKRELHEFQSICYQVPKYWIPRDGDQRNFPRIFQCCSSFNNELHIKAFLWHFIIFSVTLFNYFIIQSLASLWERYWKQSWKQSLWTFICVLCDYSDKPWNIFITRFVPLNWKLKMASFELGNEKYFLSCHERETKKKLRDRWSKTWFFMVIQNFFLVTRRKTFFF